MPSPQLPNICPNEVLLLTGAYCTPAPHLVRPRSKTSMSSPLLIVEVAAPALALALRGHSRAQRGSGHD